VEAALVVAERLKIRWSANMNKPKMTYFQTEDILHFVISGEKEAGSIELSPNITAELNRKGEVIGIEILEASSFIRDSVLESAQAKMLGATRSRKNKVRRTA
jgi:uncharacterized protein YuzE